MVWSSGLRWAVVPCSFGSGFRFPGFRLGSSLVTAPGLMVYGRVLLRFRLSVYWFSVGLLSGFGYTVRWFPVSLLRFGSGPLLVLLGLPRLPFSLLPLPFALLSSTPFGPVNRLPPSPLSFIPFCLPSVLRST
ncbi:hypothetical protein GGR53DRAFT_482740 [Hypoxylon sp. FL1150]|nr:hypothetical protein GGR53DRAFT_482740 [Hypoxylon sp. FL1150]